MTRPQPTAFEGELERRLAVLAGFASYIVLLAPDEQPSSEPVLATGKAAALARLALWLDGNATGEVLIDGPFITGDQFALFIDMEITRRATGARQPFSEIATYTVRGGAIVEERFFYG
jgi:hypothetical protein